MIVSKNKQGTDEWLKERWGMLGGSEFKDLMIKKPVKESALFFRLLGELSEEYEMKSMFVSDAMQEGTDKEPDAAEYAEEFFGLELKEFGWCTSPEFKYQGLSPDRLTPDLKQGFEFKCPQSNTHAKWLFNDELPKEHLWQNIKYFVLNDKLEKQHFCSYRPENKLNPWFYKTITLDSVLKEGKVSDLVKSAKERIIELENALDEELNKGNF